MTIEHAISTAQDASKNRYADPAVAAAHARLLEAVIRNRAPSFDLHPVPDEFEDAAKGMYSIAVAFGEFVRAVAQEARCNTESVIEIPDASLFADALHDSSLPGSLRMAAEDMREYERSGAAAADRYYKLMRETA